MRKVTPRGQLQRIKKTVRAIPLEGISILTGGNGTGKSFIRKLLSIRARDEGGKVVHASQELRTSTNPNLGGFSSFAHDLPWLSTSYCTLYNIERLPVEGAYVVLDEVEIGCSEETIMAITKWLNEWLPTCGAVGALVITHSRYVVENLVHEHFYNLDGYKDAKSWLNRKLKPTDLDELRENELFSYIRDQLNKEKKNSKC